LCFFSGTVSAINGSTCKVQLKTGEEVVAQAINVSDIGKPASLSIRPERVKLNQHSADCPNRFTGTVGELIYLGDHVRVRMSVSDTPDFIIKVPIAHLDPALRVGANMPLGWDTADIRALDPL
jgi:putative spermidine/putrescine transport system ATP-binding protein